MGLQHGWFSERAVASVAERSSSRMREDLEEKFALICLFAIWKSSGKRRNNAALLVASSIRQCN